MLKKQNKCVNCGKTTVNPKFCGRSCSATYNNKAYPKRKPEGQCKICGTPIRSQRLMCKICKLNKEKEIQRKSQNIHTFQGPSGTFEAKLPHMHCISRTVFNTRSKRVDKTTPCGEVIYSLLGLLVEAPPYILPADKQWLSAMLIHMLQNKFKCNTLHGNTTVVSIADLPISQMNYYLRKWVESFF